MEKQPESSGAQFVRGQRFSQANLGPDFQGKIAGQRRLFKYLLLLLTVVLSVVANLLLGFAGGILSANSILASEARSQFQMVTPIVLIIMAVAVTQDVVTVALVAIFCFGAAIGLSILLAIAGLITGLPTFLITLVVGTGLCLGLSIASFLTVRFTFAIADILLVKSGPLKVTITVISLLAAAVTSFVMIDDALSRADDGAALTSTTYWTMLALGAGYGPLLTVGAWLSNRSRGTPWVHPSPQRSFSLAVGSFQGTSFANLDISQVNFTNAKLANCDLRARQLYRTCFQNVIGLERARVDSQYLDLEYPKVQQLLVGKKVERNFKGLNLQGAYLQGADLRGFDFTDTNLTGADLKNVDLRESLLVRTQLAGVDLGGVDLRKNILIDANLTEANLHSADLRDCILVRAQVARADFTEADLSGICIEDWSVSAQTRFTNVRCDYIYRKYREGKPSDRYPIGRNFEPNEFATLFAEPEDIVELVFKGEFDYAALSLSLYKLQTEAPDLGIELKGIEQRGNLWVVKVKSSNDKINEFLIEERLNAVYPLAPNGETRDETVAATIKDSIYRDYEETKSRLAESERLVRQLAGLSGNQAEALKELTKRSLGNNFFISGSTITNLAGSGNIEYQEAAERVRSLVTSADDADATFQRLISLLTRQNVATTDEAQQELIQQILLSEAEQDPRFQQFLLHQGPQMISSLPNSGVANALQAAITALTA
ncbi:MAG: pentapeptide repeat-containing protein [Phormidesmis sp.]